MNINTLIAYHYFAHYRLPILKELSSEKDMIYTFISGLATDVDIRIIDPAVMKENHIVWKKTINIWLFRKSILWQVGLIWECVFGKYENIIFLGSPYFISTWFALIISRITKKRVFLWTHGIVRNNKRDLLKIKFYELAHSLFLYGNTAKISLQKNGFKSENLHVVYNSLDYQTQTQLRCYLTPALLLDKKREIFNHPHLPTLLFIGRLTRKKRIADLLSVCKTLCSKGHEINLLIIGDGAEKKQLLSLVLEMKLHDHVVFYGECYEEEELSKLIALCDVCVSPGNIGLSCIHSLSYGTPVITHNNPLEQMPEFEAIVPGETGLLFTQGSLLALEDAIIDWIKYSKDNREKIRTKCYDRIDQCYNPSFQAKVFSSVLRRN